MLAERRRGEAPHSGHPASRAGQPVAGDDEGARTASNRARRQPSMTSRRWRRCLQRRRRWGALANESTTAARPGDGARARRSRHDRADANVEDSSLRSEPSQMAPAKDISASPKTTQGSSSSTSSAFVAVSSCSGPRAEGQRCRAELVDRVGGRAGSVSHLWQQLTKTKRDCTVGHVAANDRPRPEQAVDDQHCGAPRRRPRTA